MVAPALPSESQGGAGKQIHIYAYPTGTRAPAPTSNMSRFPPLSGIRTSSHSTGSGALAPTATPPGSRPDGARTRSRIPRAPVLPRPTHHLQVPPCARHLVPRAVVLPRPPQHVQVPARRGVHMSPHPTPHPTRSRSATNARHSATPRRAPAAVAVSLAINATPPDPAAAASGTVRRLASRYWSGDPSPSPD
jgi:hypothetical protein